MKENHKKYLIALATYLDDLERTGIADGRPGPNGHVEISDHKAVQISVILKEMVADA